MFFTTAVDTMKAGGLAPEEISERLDPVELQLEARLLQAEVDDPGPPIPETFFEQFCVEHDAGVPHPEDPDKLLFPDGWTFAAYSDDGPCWPPPGDPSEVKRLQVLYFQERQSMVAREADYLRGLLMDPRHEAVPDLFATYRDSLEWCEGDLKRTAQALEELEGG